jgi:hypothetical protein
MIDLRKPPVGFPNVIIPPSPAALSPATERRAGQDGSQPETETACRRRPLWLTLVLGTVVGLLGAVGMEVIDVTLGSNFHSVVRGRVFRSAQLSSAGLEQTVRAYGIRTVINLRGWCGTDPWYLEEIQTTRRLKVAMEDVGLWATQPPPPGEMRHLVEVLDHAAYPILIHCCSGGDRTGLVSVVVLLLQTDTTPEEARQQLRMRYGHSPFGSSSCLMRFIDRYTEWLACAGLHHTPGRLRWWIYHKYNPVDCQ